MDKRANLSIETPMSQIKFILIIVTIQIWGKKKKNGKKGSVKNAVFTKFSK